MGAKAAKAFFAQLGRLLFDQGKLFAQTGLLAHSDDHASVDDPIFILQREAVDRKRCSQAAWRFAPLLM